MISGIHDSGISGWWKYSAYLTAFLPGERTPRCALARSNVIYICASYTCLHTGDSTTPLLSAQRVSPLRFVGINKQSRTTVVSNHVFQHPTQRCHRKPFLFYLVLLITCYDRSCLLSVNFNSLTNVVGLI